MLSANDRRIALRIDELIAWGFLEPIIVHRGDQKTRTTTLTQKGFACLSSCAEPPLPRRITINKS